MLTFDLVRSEHNKYEHVSTNIYIVFVAIYQIIFIYAFVKAILNISKEFRSESIDVFRVTQMSFIIGFLVSRNIYWLMCRIQGFEFFQLTFISLNTFFFYYFEVINNICWITFILHLTACENPQQMDDRLLKRIRVKEKILLFLGAVLAIVILTLWIMITIVSLAYQWQNSKLYFMDGHLYFSSPECENIDYTARVMAKICLYIGVVATISKIFIGFLMLYIMKKRFNHPYMKVKNGVILTILTTIVIMTMNISLNMFEQYSFSKFYLFVIVPLKGLKTGVILFSFFWSLVNVILEIFLMGFAAQNIYFREYIITLMEGRRRLDLISKTSIYLLYRESKWCLSLRSSTKSQEACAFLNSRNTLSNGRNNEYSKDTYEAEAFVNFEEDWKETCDFTSRKYTELFDQLRAQGNTSRDSKLSSNINKTHTEKESLLTSEY